MACEREKASTVQYSLDKKNFYEVYFVKWIDPAANYVGWIRYTLLHSMESISEAAVWAVFINQSDSSQNIAIKQNFSLNQIKIEDNKLIFKIGNDAGISNKKAWGNISNNNTYLKWDLSIDQDGLIIHHIPKQLYSGSFPRTKFVAPQCGCRLSGYFDINGKVIQLKQMTGLIAHFWGTKQVATWAWANCINFKEDSAFYFDGVSARMRMGSYLLRPMTCLFFNWEGKLYSCNSIISAFITNKSQHALHGWNFSAKKDNYKFSGSIAANSDLMLMYKSYDPDGEVKYTHLTFSGKIVIDIAKPVKSGWKIIKTMTAEKSCTYENAYEFYDKRVQWNVG